MIEFQPYPILFKPILKERIWGGNKLKTVLNKSNVTNTTGESWEISSVENEISIILNGIYQDRNLTQLINDFPVETLGTAVFIKFGKEFPLLFKFLDAKQELSIQVHPNDALAKKRHQSFGKTEMWYVIQAEENAKIIVGFKEKSSPEEYLHHLENKTLLKILNEIVVKKGDVFLLESGTIHAIGAGIVIAEIQQTSDITYRVYDWDRMDNHGNARELHTDLALEAINYNTKNTKKEYNKTLNVSNLAVDCPFFTTKIIPLQGEIIFKTNKQSFTVLMCTDGDFELYYNNQTEQYNIGDTILIPAFLTDFKLTGKATILEISL